MRISTSLYNKTLDKLTKVEEELKQYKAVNQDLQASLSTQNQEVEKAYKDRENYVRENYGLRTILRGAEKDLQRLALAYETIRSTVQLTSAQLNLDEINPTITSSITSLVKTNQTNQTPETN